MQHEQSNHRLHDASVLGSEPVQLQVAQDVLESEGAHVFLLQKKYVFCLPGQAINVPACGVQFSNFRKEFKKSAGKSEQLTSRNSFSHLHPLLSCTDLLQSKHGTTSSSR